MLCLLAANSSFQGLKKGNTDSTVVSVYGTCLQMNSSKYQNTAITPFRPCSLLSMCGSLDLAWITEQCEYGTSQMTSLSLFEITITGNGSDGMHAAPGSAGKIAYIQSVECRELAIGLFWNVENQWALAYPQGRKESRLRFYRSDRPYLEFRNWPTTFNIL